MNETPKHTPGLWQWRQIRNSKDIVIESSETGQLLARVFHTDLGDVLANARLFTAAPKLLECCKTAIAMLAGVAAEYELSGSREKARLYRDAIQDLEFPIAKAEGRES